VNAPPKPPIELHPPHRGGPPRAEPDEHPARPGERVEWKAPGGNRWIVVVTEEESPFEGDERTFGNFPGFRPSGAIKAKGALDPNRKEYKYLFIFRDRRGKEHVVDPKIVIREI